MKPAVIGCMALIAVLIAGCANHREGAIGARNLAEAARALQGGADVAKVAPAMESVAEALARELDPRSELQATVPASLWIQVPERAVIGAHVQAARIDMEREANERTAAMTSWAQGQGSLLLGGIASAVLGTGAGAWVIRTLRTLGTTRKALQDAIAYGSDAEAIDPNDQAAKDALQAEHAKRQAARGTQTVIKQALAVHNGQA